MSSDSESMNSSPPPSPRRDLNWLWFLFLGSSVGLVLEHPIAGGLAGLGAWAVRRGLGERDSR